MASLPKGKVYVSLGKFTEGKKQPKRNGTRHSLRHGQLAWRPITSHEFVWHFERINSIPGQQLHTDTRVLAQPGRDVSAQVATRGLAIGLKRRPRGLEAMFSRL